MIEGFEWVEGLIVTPLGVVISEEEASAFLSPQEMANLRKKQHEDFFRRF